MQINIEACAPNEAPTNVCFAETRAKGYPADSFRIVPHRFE